MARESYGRCDDGVHWAVYHELWSGPWWWELVLPDGTRIESPERYETEAQARAAVEDAHRQALAGLPPVETMATLRARAEAAEARAAQAEADARLLGSLYYADDGGAFLALRQAAALTEAEVDALGEIEASLFRTPDEEVAAALRRVLKTAPR